jgi:dephospho-CoA kinase
VKHERIRVIGLTGGIATGKSCVARFFQDRGVTVIDADLLSRDVVQPGSKGLGLVVGAFGAGILAPDGTLNRAQLREIVFSDGNKRRQLEEILHPEIKRLAEESIARAATDGQKIVFYMAPLLIEAGAIDRVDELWVVTVRPEIQISRLMARDGISQDQALQMVASQMPLADKERCGRVVIDNSGSPDETEVFLNELWIREIEGQP